MIDEPLDLLVSRADLDGLVRLIDERCTGRDWDGLMRVRDRARAAVTTGRQLWPAATLAEYRLALLGPPALVAHVLADDRAGRFAMGPLAEVAAQHHTWAELAPHLDVGPYVALVAHERVLRGEPIDPATVASVPNVVDLPYSLADWEPEYCLAEYHDSDALFPSPSPMSQNRAHKRALARHEPAEGVPDVPEVLAGDDAHDVTEAVRELVSSWTAGSNGRAEVVGVAGAPGHALRALGVPQANLVPLTPAEALAWLGWAGASGGAHGRRRGAAMGRFAAWWLVAALGDIVDRWPPEADDMGHLVGELEWAWWDAGEPETGWRLQIVVHDPVDDVSWAISAHDAV